MNSQQAFEDFTKRFEVVLQKNPALITQTLSNIFTMRLIGNKTHGDLAEIAISEFINQFMYDFKSTHVGKDMYRAKEHEEDISILNEITKVNFSISLKAYGDGPLQLSTDKNSGMFPHLKKQGKAIKSPDKIKKIFKSPAFSEFGQLNVLPLIYDEKAKRCSIMIFDFEKAQRETAAISIATAGAGRKHPVYKFLDSKGNYICEVRYGDAAANALQRGLWTNTKNAQAYFHSITGGWINYSENPLLVTLFSHALISTPTGHESALKELKTDIERQKKGLK